MVLACYGLAYWWASYHPVHYWPIVMVGFLGKIFGSIGFFINFLSGNADLNYLYMLFFNPNHALELCSEALNSWFKQGVRKENSRSYVTEEQHSLNQIVIINSFLFGGIRFDAISVFWFIKCAIRGCSKFSNACFGFSDFIWWIPFWMILKRAYEANWSLVKQSDQ